MPALADPTDVLIQEASVVPLAEALGLPTDRLLGVSSAAKAVLASLGIETIFDLATSRVFDAARQIDDAATNAANAINRFGRTPTDLLKPGLPGTVAVAELRNESIDILVDVTDAATMQAALGVTTVRDLSVYPPYLAAREILARVFFPDQLDAFDPEAPADLVPRSGEFPTERVQYTTLVLDSILRPDNAPPLIDVASAAFTPIDIAPVVDPSFGFSTLGLGMLLTFNQSWFMQGVTLGHLLHSMALAAGESTRIAVVDWSRKTSAGQTEQIGETEDLSQDTSRNRSISEVTEAVAREAQEGFSKTSASSTTKQAGASAGFSIGPFGGGASGSISKTNTSAESYATSAGSREVGASMLQNVNDRTHQQAHAARTRRASVVREVSQTEHESVSTRVVTNYNHMHALTVQYYEVLQIYRAETALTRCDRAVFVPFKLVDFANEDVLRRFRGVLIDAALTEPIRDALVNFDTLELAPERSTVFPGVGGKLGDVIATRPVVRGAGLSRVAFAAARIRDGEELPEPDDEPTEPRPPVVRPPRPPIDDIADDLWATSAPRLAAFFKAPTTRRNSQSLFVSSDVRVEEGVVQSTVRTMRLAFILRDGTRITDLTTGIPLSDVDRIAIVGSDPAADIPATGALALSRNGIVFPLELPTVTVARGSQETPVIDVRAAGADINVVEHLMDNQLHYSQAIYRNLDAAMLAGLLAPYSVTINEQSLPLVQVAEPTPVRIVGNALVFKINTDPINDEEWRDFMASRGVQIGDSKVDIVPLSSGGIFAEAVLGRFNCAERLDLSRFFNWQDSPIPIQPTDIAAIQLGSRATAEDVRPGQLGAPIVNITQPAAIPDPSGLAGTLATLQNGALFRDMSGLAQTIQLATETAKLSAAGATAVGAQATDSLKTAVNADVERRKIDATAVTERQRIAAQLEAAKLGKSLQDKNITEAGAVVNKEEDLKNKAGNAPAGGSASGGGAAGGKAGGAAGGGAAGGGAAGGGAASGGGAAGGGAASGGGGASGGTSTAVPTSTGNAALDRIIGNDTALRSFIGLPDDSPVPTPPVTAEGVPLQTWDVVPDLNLLIRDANGDPDLATAADVQEIIDLGAYNALTSDILDMTLGDRTVRTTGFDEALRSLALAPSGSISKLNLFGHVTTLPGALALDVQFVHSRGSADFPEVVVSDGTTRPFRHPTLASLVTLANTDKITVDGIDVKLNDVRRAFSVEGEVRVFNFGFALEADFVQALANVLHTRVTAFISAPVRVTVTVLGETASGNPILSRTTDVGFPFQPVGTQFDFFENLLTLDRSISGTFTAFPRR